MRARQRLLILPRSRKPDLCQLPRAFLGEGEKIGAVTVVAIIENRCGRRDKSGFHPNLSSQRAGQITFHNLSKSSP